MSPIIKVKTANALCGLTKRHTGDSGYDITAREERKIAPGATEVIPTGVWLEMPKGWQALVCSRSGLATKGVFVANAPGVIDSGYRGEVQVILCNTGPDWFWIHAGERIAQLLFQPVHEVVLDAVGEVKVDTDRGEAGLGSTGTK